MYELHIFKVKNKTQSYPAMTTQIIGICNDNSLSAWFSVLEWYRFVQTVLYTHVFVQYRFLEYILPSGKFFISLITLYIPSEFDERLNSVQCLDAEEAQPANEKKIDMFFCLYFGYFCTSLIKYFHITLGCGDIKEDCFRWYTAVHDKTCT